MIYPLTRDDDLKTYDTWVRSHPWGSLWQSLEWKRYQEALGREIRIYVSVEEERIFASALVVIDRTSFGFSVWNVPRGPLACGMENGKSLDATRDRWKMEHDVLLRIIEDARKDRCLAIYFSPPREFSMINFQFPIRPSSRHEQPEATRLIDLTLPDEEILRQMKPKGRYNISVAEKHGISVTPSRDIGAFHRLLKLTSQRDRFGILPKSHYEAFLESLPGSFLLLASLPPNPEPIAGLLGVVWRNIGIYYYGASSYAFRALMAPYALQWAAMQHCKILGCTSYDLLGIVPPSPPTPSPHGGGATGWGKWAGISTFKEKFGGTAVTYPPEQQFALRPITSGLLSLKRQLFG
jgi:lipid II:glycine glycyltransferase (peptidoglycan interpeptide bridge formation enzyme)